MPSEQALQLAATAWCTPETSSITMDDRLCKAFADILDREAELAKLYWHIPTKYPNPIKTVEYDHVDPFPTIPYWGDAHPDTAQVTGTGDHLADTVKFTVTGDHADYRP